MSARVLWLWLATRKSVGARTHQALLQRFGRVEQIYAADRRALTETPGLLKSQVDALCDKDTCEAERISERCGSLGISILTIADAGYPDRLRQIADPPIVLYVRGALPDLDDIPGIAVVGTRRSTLYGEKTAQTMAGGLAQAGFIIVTGMALGVDGAASRGALRAGGKTVAVLGGGVDVCYPMQHRALMGDILLSGAILSEYPPGTRALPQHFPVRNRIISGLCVGTLVIEAPLRSGALITAHEALDQGRDVFAVPGSVDLDSFKGSNAMLARGEAQLVTTPLEIIREYAGLLREEPDEARISRTFNRLIGAQPEPATVRAEEPALPDHLSETELRIIAAIREGAAGADEIADRTGLPAPLVTAAITMLELDGVIKRESGRLVPAT